METLNISGRICHALINGADFPTVYWGEMKNSSDSVEKVLDLCRDVKCNFIVYEADDWNSDFSPWKFDLNRKMSFSGGGRRTLEWLADECVHFLSLIHISEPTRLLSISYAVFCLKKKTIPPLISYHEFQIYICTAD